MRLLSIGFVVSILLNSMAYAEQVQVEGPMARRLYQVMSDMNLLRDGNAMSATNVNCAAPVAVGMGSFRACTLVDSNGEKLKIYNALAGELAENLMQVIGKVQASSVSCDSSTDGYVCEVVE